MKGAPTTVAAAVHPGPMVLEHIAEDSSYRAHRERVGRLERRHASKLIELTAHVDLRGCGGADFPFAAKVDACQSQRSVVVVNVAESEPTSVKDATLAIGTPHLVLDGAQITAEALHAKDIHLVAPQGRPGVAVALRKAIQEREVDHSPVTWHLHQTQDRFVAGEASAVLELLAGRENLPVTRTAPATERGVRGRPTVLSNAETFARVAVLSRIGPGAYIAQGRPGSSGTVLVTINSNGLQPNVHELPSGTTLGEALGPAWQPSQPVLLGGYHGTWLHPEDAATVRLDRSADAGNPPLGAGAILALSEGQCPVMRTARIARFLAAQSANRCGPCKMGLPALAVAIDHLARGIDTVGRIQELALLVIERGACGHPDATARLVASLLVAFPDEVTHHQNGRCGLGAPVATAATTPAITHGAPVSTDTSMRLSPVLTPLPDPATISAPVNGTPIVLPDRNLIPSASTSIPQPRPDVSGELPVWQPGGILRGLPPLPTSKETEGGHS
ncbi:MAG: NADH-ubiquinone oxidoreductase-F iron-sulfur binding region domain-containing protein [Actinomycetota bacterium]